MICPLCKSEFESQPADPYLKCELGCTFLYMDGDKITGYVFKNTGGYPGYEVVSSQVGKRTVLFKFNHDHNTYQEVMMQIETYIPIEDTKELPKVIERLLNLKAFS